METEPKAAEPQATPAPQTPEEQLKALQTKLTDYETQLKEKQRIEDGYKGLQRELNKKDTELKSARELHSRLDALEETQKIYAALMAENMGKSPDVEEPQQKVDLLKKFDEVAARQKQLRQESETRAKQEEYFRQADEVYSLAKQTFGEDDVDNLESIRRMIKNGDIDLAEKKISKAKKSAVPNEPKQEKTETEEQRINKLVEARIAELTKNNPLLKTESATPTGKATSRADADAKYARGEISTDEWLAARK